MGIKLENKQDINGIQLNNYDFAMREDLELTNTNVLNNSAQMDEIKQDVNLLKTQTSVKQIAISQTDWDALIEYEDGAYYNVYADILSLPNLLSSNKMLNPVFSGITNYEGSNGSISVSANVLTLTGSGAGNQVRLRQYDVDTTAVATNTIFASFMVRELDGLSPDIWLVLRVNGSDVVIKEIENITQNVWTPLYAKYNLLADGVERVQVYAVYADATEATGARIQFEGLEVNEGMALYYNLTDFDADNSTDYSTLTDSEVYAIRYQVG